MKIRKLVCGVGTNDADYVVEKRETIGYVNGKQKQKLVWTCPKCSVESNVLEWPWEGRPTNSGYQVVNTCPSCKYNFVEEM